MEKNAEYGGQPEILAHVHARKRPVTVHCEDLDKGTVFGEFLLIALAQTFFIIQKNVTTLQHCRVNLKMKRSILWVTMLLFAQKQMIGSCV